MDPLLLIAGSLGVAGHTISGLNAVWQFLKICQQIDNAAEDAQIFIRQLRQVSEDFDYAMTLRSSLVQDHNRVRASMQDKWIYTVLMGTAEELDDFGRHVQRYDEDNADDLRPLDSFRAKVRFTLKDADSLKLRQDGLRAAHSRLLTAITAMHCVGPSIVSPGLQMPTRPLSAPVIQGKSRPRRASRMPSVDDDEVAKEKESQEEKADPRSLDPVIPAPPTYEKSPECVSKSCTE